MTHALGWDEEASLTFGEFSQIGFGKREEVFVFDRCKLDVTAPAKQSADCARDMVVIDIWLDERLRAASTETALLLDHSMKIGYGQAVIVSEPSLQRSVRIVSVEKARKPTSSAVLAARPVTVERTSTESEISEGLNGPTRLTRFLSDRRLGKQLDFEFAEAGVLVATQLTDSGYTKPIAGIDAELGELLTLSTSGTCFHSTSLPGPAYVV